MISHYFFFSIPEINPCTCYIHVTMTKLYSNQIHIQYYQDPNINPLKTDTEKWAKFALLSTNCQYPHIIALNTYNNNTHTKHITNKVHIWQIYNHIGPLNAPNTFYLNLWKWYIYIYIFFFCMFKYNIGDGWEGRRTGQHWSRPGLCVGRQHVARGAYTCMPFRSNTH